MVLTQDHPQDDQVLQHQGQDHKYQDEDLQKVVLNGSKTKTVLENNICDCLQLNTS